MKNLFPTLVATFLLKGGLNQVMFLLIFFLGSLWRGSFGSWFVPSVGFGEVVNFSSLCFPPNNKLHKIINKNTVKLSYSCMNNVQQIINSHNKTILTSAAENNSKLCNCREKNSCPLNGK